MVIRRLLFNGKNGMKMLRFGGVCVLYTLSTPHVFGHSHAFNANYSTYWQNEITVQGTVKNGATGEVMPGVTVSIKGSDKATTTDNEGHYLIEGVSGTATLVFTSVDVETKEVAVANQTTIDISLTTSEA